MTSSVESAIVADVKAAAPGVMASTESVASTVVSDVKAAAPGVMASTESVASTVVSDVKAAAPGVLADVEITATRAFDGIVAEAAVVSKSGVVGKIWAFVVSTVGLAFTALAASLKAVFSGLSSLVGLIPGAAGIKLILIVACVAGSLGFAFFRGYEYAAVADKLKASEAALAVATAQAKAAQDIAAKDAEAASAAKAQVATLNNQLADFSNAIKTPKAVIACGSAIPGNVYQQLLNIRSGR